MKAPVICPEMKILTCHLEVKFLLKLINSNLNIKIRDTPNKQMDRSILERIKTCMKHATKHRVMWPVRSTHTCLMGHLIVELRILLVRLILYSIVCQLTMGTARVIKPKDFIDSSMSK